MKVAIYCRVSTIDKGQTLEQQQVPLIAYCKKEGFDYEVFKDFASGSKETRPQLDIMMQKIRSRELNGVIIFRLDRLGRSLKHLLQLVEEFKKLNVRLVVYTQTIDTNTAQGMFFLQILGAAAEFERQLIRERIKDKLDYLKSEGKKLGRPVDSKDKKPRKKEGYIQRWNKKEKKAWLDTPQISPKNTKEKQDKTKNKQSGDYLQ